MKHPPMKKEEIITSYFDLIRRFLGAEKFAKLPREDKQVVKRISRLHGKVGSYHRVEKEDQEALIGA